MLALEGALIIVICHHHDPQGDIGAVSLSLLNAELVARVRLHVPMGHRVLKSGKDFRELAIEI